MVLEATFFERDTTLVAKELLGKHLVRKTPTAIQRAIIHEVEVYDGLEDLGSHARFGKTQRTAPMFGPPGYWYIYLVYGMYSMINITTQKQGYPAAILIRGAGQWHGPGKLAKGLGVNRELNNQPADTNHGMWIEDSDIMYTEEQIQKTPRIGIPYAKEWKEKPLRFFIALP